LIKTVIILFKMKTEKFTEFNLPQDAYATFDATTLKSLIIDRLSRSEIFTDQTFEGSNLNAFIDVVAYMYHVLLFYLNTTAAESTFTTASLYENINKLVSNLNYKPLGKQTSLATISLSGNSTIQPGFYTIPRFSFININSLNYTTLSDISFEKTTNGTQVLQVDSNILHQGTITPFPIYIAQGEEFETVTIINRKPDLARVKEDKNRDKFIADNTFSVFVKNAKTDQWEEWKETSSLYLEASLSKRFEKRLNEYGNFELKFGDNKNGRALKEGDEVQVFYIVSDNTSGQVSSNILNGGAFTLYDSTIFREIKQDIYPSDIFFLPLNLLSGISVNNENDSTPVVMEEDVEAIRNNAPKIFTLQNRLVTKQDYETLINRRFNNIFKQVKVLSNEEYTSQYLKYFYKIGLNKPNTDARVLLNQVGYSNSTMFNNVYVFCVPKQLPVSTECIPNYVNTTQKQLIVNECNQVKDITHNVVPSDPIYKAVAIGLNIAGEEPCSDVYTKTKLVIKRDRNTSINNALIKGNVFKIFSDHFNNLELGSTINLTEISNSILNIAGVDSIVTRREDVNFELPFISCVVWNPTYETEDVVITSQNIQLTNFEYAYFFNISSLTDNIIIESV